MTTVLVVDDDPEVLSVLERFLTRTGFQVFCASDTERAMELLIEERPGVVLVDLMLGRENGWDTLRKLREGTEAPILVMTGTGVDENTLENARVLGAQGVLPKPFDLEGLAARLGKLLGDPPGEG